MRFEVAPDGQKEQERKENIRPDSSWAGVTLARNPPLVGGSVGAVMDKELLSQLPMVLSAVAGVFTALATLVWAFRRRP